MILAPGLRAGAFTVDKTMSAMPQSQTETTKLFDDLPPFPPVALKLSQALGEDSTAVSDVVDLVASDPALAADILRRANSPAYGFGRRVNSLREALVLLGFGELRRLSLARATAGMTGAAFQAFPMLRRCWRHSLAVAALAERLAPEFDLPPDRAYTAGLLHDVGRLGLLAVCPTQYSELLIRAAREAPPDDVAYLLEMERLVFGVDHCTAGRGLSESWGMPEEIVMAAGRHHDRIQNPAWGLLELIQGSSRLADALGFGALDREQRLPMEAAIQGFPEQKGLEIQVNRRELASYVEARIERLDGEASADEEPEETEDEAPAADSAKAHLKLTEPEAPPWLMAVAFALIVALAGVLYLVSKP